MDEKQLQQLKALAEGVDPTTGETFPAGSPYQKPEIIRILYNAHDTLRRNGARGGNGRQLPARSGQPWTDEEEKRLLARFEAGESEQEIARRLERTKVAVTARLVKLGKIDPPPDLRLRGDAGNDRRA